MPSRSKVYNVLTVCTVLDVIIVYSNILSSALLFMRYYIDIQRPRPALPEIALGFHPNSLFSVMLKSETYHLKISTSMSTSQKNFLENKKRSDFSLSFLIYCTLVLVSGKSIPTAIQEKVFFFFLSHALLTGGDADFLTHV